MKMYVIRSEEKHFGVCYHGFDGVCVRSPLDAQKHKTFEAARKAGGEPETTNYEIVPVTFNFEIEEAGIITIVPEIEEDEVTPTTE